MQKWMLIYPSVSVINKSPNQTSFGKVFHALPWLNWFKSF